MSKVDRNKLLANAQKLIQRGDLPRAVQQYEQLLEAQPKDVQSLLRLAGLYIRVDRIDDAVAAYSNAGRQYSSTGFYQKAVAAYKQALQLKDKDPDLLHELGVLYNQMGLRGPAVEHFARAAHFFSAVGKQDRAIEIMSAALELEPDRPDMKARYGEFLYQAGRKDEAIAVFRGLIEILKLEGQWEDLSRFYERILQINPSDNEIGMDLARTYLRLGLAPKALQRLKVLFDAGIREAEVFDLLARAYVLMGKNSKAVNAYLEKAKRLNPAKDADEIEKTYRRILEIDPTNEDALAALGESEDDSEVLHIFDDTPPVQRETVVEVVAIDDDAPAPAIASQVDATGGEFSEILQEASVYIRYGIKEKAVKKLDQILSKDPNNIAALKKRIEVYAESDPARTIPDLVRLSEIHEALGDLDSAERFIAEAKAIDANHPALRSFLGIADDSQMIGARSVGGNVAEVLTTGAASDMYPDAGDFISDGRGEPEAEPDAEQDELDIDLDVESDDAAVLPAQGQNVVSDAGPPPYADDLEQAVFFVDAGLADEARKLLSSLIEQYGQQPEFLELQARLPAPKPVAQPTAKPTAKSTPQPAPAATPAKPTQAATPGAKSVPVAVTPPAAPAKPATATAGGALGGLFDIAKELESEFDIEGVADISPGAEDVPSFEEIFEAFKKGVKTQISDEDADAHYDLGIAYMEMGIMNEALNEFEIARAKPAKAPDAYNMMAITLTRIDDFKGAIEKYEAGLALPNLDEAIYLNMHYEVALLYEKLGQFKEALLHFKKVVEKDKNYREISDCLKRMRDKVAALKAGGSTVA